MNLVDLLANESSSQSLIFDNNFLSYDLRELNSQKGKQTYLDRLGILMSDRVLPISYSIPEVLDEFSRYVSLLKLRKNYSENLRVGFISNDKIYRFAKRYKDKLSKHRLNVEDMRTYTQIENLILKIEDQYTLDSDFSSKRFGFLRTDAKIVSSAIYNVTQNHLPTKIFSSDKDIMLLLRSTISFLENFGIDIKRNIHLFAENMLSGQSKEITVYGRSISKKGFSKLDLKVIEDLVERLRV